MIELAIKQIKVVLFFIAFGAVLGCANQDEVLYNNLKQLESNYASMRKSAARNLGRLGDSRAVEALIQVLKKDAESQVRLAAADALGRLGDGRAVRALLEAVDNDPDNMVRISSFKSLISIDDTSAIGELIFALKNSTNSDCRYAAATALGNMKNSRSVKTLIEALQTDSSIFVRSTAAEALGGSQNEEAVDALVEALEREEDENILSSVSKALGQTGSEKAFSALVNTLKDTRINQKVARILDDSGWKPDSIEEKIHYLVANREGDELRDLWRDAKKILLNDLESTNFWHIKNSVHAFIGLGMEDSLTSLVDKLNKRGNKQMAVVYLNCGNEKLRDAAANWAQRHGYTIISKPGTSPLGWGSW